jgi:hypothetical protein
MCTGIHPPSSASILTAALQGPELAIWRGAWQSVIVDTLSRHAQDCIDFAAGRVDDEFKALDDQLARSALLPVSPTIREACAEALLTRREELNGLLQTAGRHRQSARQLRTTLIDFGVIDSLLNSPISVAELTHVDLTATWTRLAHEIARRLYAAEVSATPELEWLVHNRLLLARYFQGCRVNRATQVANHLNQLMSGIHGPRSALVGIIERIGPDGIEDAPLPPAPANPTGLALISAHLSDLLDAVNFEAPRIPNRQGFMHRLVDVNANRAIPSSLQHVLTPEMLIEYRSRSYRQYESTLLCYTVLSAVEQLLRTLAVHFNVDHMGVGYYPAPVLEWVDDPHLSLSHLVRADVEEVYSPTQANLRNRAMHSALFEIESKRLEMTLAQYNPAINGTPINLADDPLVPEHMLALVIERLARLDQHAATIGLLPQDFAWADEVWLTAEELAFGNSIYCDVLDSDEELALMWQQQVFDFVSACAPPFSIFLKMAWLGWFKPYEQHDSLLSFVAWGLTFEGVYRLTVQCLGFEVLQRSPLGATGRMLQYRMLDARATGLCRQAILDALVEELAPSERAIATRTVQLAVKARNAMSHGALLRHDENDHLAAGHLFIKATQLLMSVTIRHMTRVRAYFRYLHRPPERAPDAVGDWLAAESETLDTIRRLANAQRGL